MSGPDQVAGVGDGTGPKDNPVTRQRELEIKQLGTFADLLGPQIDRLAGYTNEQGETVPGLLFDPQHRDLLETMIDMPRRLEAIPAQRDRWWTRLLGSKPSYESQRYVPDTTRGVAELRDFFTNDFLKLTEPSESDKQTLWLGNPAEFSLQWGKAAIDKALSVTRTTSLGQATPEGHVPFITDGRFTSIQIEPTSSEDVIDEVYELVMDGDSPRVDPEDKPVKERSAGKRFRPTLRMTITEEGADRKVETYVMHRVETESGEQGILIQCSPEVPPTLHTRKTVGIAMRKPVIYLYPTKKTNVTVKLDFKGQLTNTYPQINGDTWKVSAFPDGTLKTNGKKYKYLFWDGVNDNVDWDWSKGFCVHRDDVDNFIEEKTEQLGLNFSEAQDFITYWAPMIKQNEWSLVSFQTEKYEELAKLEISPKPDSLIRVFMVFKKVDAEVAIAPQKLKKIKRKGFTVVEWGGSNLDELQLRPQQFKNNGFSIINHKSAAVFA